MYAAGILPIAWTADGPKFLLGKDARDHTYSDFAGRAERIDKDIQACAAREFWEETYGLVCDARAMRARLYPGNAVVLTSKTQNGLPFYCFVVEMPYVPWLRSAFLKTVAHFKNRAIPRLYIEKTDGRWVGWTELVSGDLPKRGVFRATVDQHRAVLDRLVAAGPAGWKAQCALSEWPG